MSGQALNGFTIVLIRGRHRRFDGKKGDLKTEAETGVMGPQVKECQQPSKAGRGKEQILLWGLQKELSLLTLV